MMTRLPLPGQSGAGHAVAGRQDIGASSDAARPAESNDDICLTRDQCEQLLIEHLPMIKRQLRTVARQRHLSPDDADEFVAIALMRLVADDYSVLRKFRGRCSLGAYLSVVFQRMCLDFRVAQWGKWRHSMASRRHGDVALLLERLTVRDGLTFEEACSVITINHGLTPERDTLARLHASFVDRTRPRLVSENELAERPCIGASADRGLVEAMKRDVLREAVERLGAALATLTPQEQLVLKLRFSEGLRVAEIAQLLQMNQKGLYRQIERLLARLRRHIETPAIRGPEVLMTLGSVDLEGTRLFPSDAASQASHV